MAIKTYGTMAVDWEQRIDFDRLRRERLARVKEQLGQVGARRRALLRHEQRALHHVDPYRHVGAGQGGALHAAAAERRADSLGLRVRRAPSPAELPVARRALASQASACCAARCVRKWAGPRTSRRRSASSSRSAAFRTSRSASTWSNRRSCSRCSARASTVVDGQQILSDAREIKTQDEISLLTHSAAMVDAAYHELYMAMKPGMRENEAVGLVNKILYDAGSEYVEGVNAISGERCSPHPHVFSDRVMRPGDPAYYDILHSYMGYRTCYYRIVRDQLRAARDDRRLQALPRLSRCRHRADPPGSDDGRGRVCLAAGAGVRLPE